MEHTSKTIQNLQTYQFSRNYSTYNTKHTLTLHPFKNTNMHTYIITDANRQNTYTRQELRNLEHEIFKYLLNNDPDPDSSLAVLEQFSDTSVFPVFFVGLFLGIFPDSCMLPSVCPQLQLPVLPSIYSNSWNALSTG